MAVVFGQDLTKINAPAFARVMLSHRQKKQGATESESLSRGAVPLDAAEKVVLDTFLESVAVDVGKCVLNKVGKIAESMASVFFGECITLTKIEQRWLSLVMAKCPTMQDLLGQPKMDEETAAAIVRIGVPFAQFAAKIIYLARHARCRVEAALLLTLRQGRIYEAGNLLSALENSPQDWVGAYEATFRGWAACSRPILNGSVSQIRTLVWGLTGKEYPTDQITDAAELLGLKFHSHK
jgi:hypothetical protein